MTVGFAGTNRLKLPKIAMVHRNTSTKTGSSVVRELWAEVGDGVKG